VSWKEDRLHRWLAGLPRPAGLVGSVGHDGAVLAAARGRPVRCVDQCVEGVHFESGARAADVGRKAAHRALSDLAACAAEPSDLLLSVAAPRRVEEAWLRRLISAVRRAGERFGAALVGGDLSRTEGGLVVVVAASGSLPGQRRPPGRDRARPGQRLVLTGPVGGSRLGRHLRCEPRLAAGRALFEAGATAMMDVSDGLAWDLHRLARASGVRLELERVPIHRDARRAARASGRTPLDHALHDGEDHELVATLGRGRLPEGALQVGRVVAGEGLWLTGELVKDDEARRWRPGSGGWTHD